MSLHPIKQIVFIGIENIVKDKVLLSKQCQIEKQFTCGIL